MAPFPLGFLAISGASGGFGGAVLTYALGDGLFDIHYDSANSRFYVSGYSAAGTSETRLSAFNASMVNQWNKGLLSGSTTYGRGVSGDSSGNVYQSGAASGLSGGGYLAKYNSSGTLQWQRAIGSTSYPNVQYSTTISNSYVASGSIYYAAGYFYGPISVSDLNGNQVSAKTFSSHVYIDQGVGDSNGHYLNGADAFGQYPVIAKLSSNGSSMLWGKEDAANSTYNASSSSNQTSTSVLMPCRNRNSVNEAVFLRITKSNGSLDKAEKMVAPGTDYWYGRGYAQDPSGNYYYVGYENKSGARAIHIVKTSSGGTVLWKRKITSTGGNSPKSVTVDSSNIYIVSDVSDGSTNYSAIWSYPTDGSASGTVNFGTKTITIEPSSVVLANHTGMNWSNMSASYGGTPTSWNYSTSTMTQSTPSTTWNKVE